MDLNPCFVTVWPQASYFACSEPVFFLIYKIKTASKCPYFRAVEITNVRHPVNSESCISGNLVDALCMLDLIETTNLQGKYRHPPFINEGETRVALGLSFSKHSLGTKYVPGAEYGEEKEVSWSRVNMGLEARWSSLLILAV